MWPWTPTSSAPSFQSAAYPHMQHVPTAHHPFASSRLPAPQAAVFPSSQQNYYSAPNVGYSGGSQISAPQTLSVPNNWSASGQIQNHTVPEENVTYMQQQQQRTVMRSPGAITSSTPHHHIGEGTLQSSFAPQEDLYQRGLFTHPSGQSPLYQASPSVTQQSPHIGSFQASAPSQIQAFQQRPHTLPSADAHTPAFHSPPQGHPTSFQAGSPHSFPSQIANIDKPPGSSSPFQPPHLTTGSIEAHPPRASITQGPPELTLRGLEQGPPELNSQPSALIHESRDNLGYSVSTGHAQSNPFSVDFLLRDRPSNLPVDEEFTSEQQQGKNM